MQAFWIWKINSRTPYCVFTFLLARGFQNFRH